MRVVARRVCVALAMTPLVYGASCNRQPPRQSSEGASRPVVLSLAHLRHLGIDAKIGERKVRAVSLYAEAPDYRLAGSPARDGYEGVASVDDAARAAVVYLRAYEASGDTRDRTDALGLLSFIASMQTSDGEFVNFIDAHGVQNVKAPSSAKSMSYWAARSIWALGEAERVLGDSVMQQAGLRDVFNSAMGRMELDVLRGQLVGGSATATAEALLGLLAMQRAVPNTAISSLAERTAELLVVLTRGNSATAPWGAHLDSASADWHAWGARTVEALATAAIVLARPDFAVAARHEADALWSRYLVAGRVPALVDAKGDASWYPEIAYGVSPIVGGYLALAAATGESRYAAFAGLTGAWLLGDNAAHIAMYNDSAGRTFDGIDSDTSKAGVKVNRNAGAESTIEGLLALQQLTASPEAAKYLRYTRVGDASASLASLPTAREYAAPDGQRVRISLSDSGAAIHALPNTSAPKTLTYWPAANPSEVRLATLLATRWNAEHPDVQVRVQPLPAGRSSEEVLLAAIVAKATPDVSSNVSSALLARLVRAGGVVRLDDRVATAARLRERTTESMLASLRLPDGGIYAFPWKTNPEMLMYNIDQLKAAGVVPPRTQAELLDALRRLARDTNGDGRNDHWGMWATLKTTWFERFYDFYPLYLANAGGRTLVKNGDVLFENAAAEQAMELLRHAFAEGWLPKSNFALGRDPFADGTVAMKIIGPWFLKELNDLKVPGLRYDVVPVPAVDSVAASRRFAFADLRSIAIFSTTKHPDEAAQFVAYLTSPEADRMLIEEASQLPYRKALAGDARFTRSLALWPTLSTFATYVERTRDLDVDPDVVEIFDVISEAYERGAIYGIVPVKPALAKAAADVRKIIRAR